jgi:hypothetical protein
VAPGKAVIDAFLGIESFAFGFVLTALGKCLSGRDGVSDEPERDGCATSEDTGPLLQVGAAVALIRFRFISWLEN